MGICFGHQIIADALGGKVEKSPSGWGVGIKSFAVAKTQPWMQPIREKISLLFSHQDQVMQIPKSAILLAQNDFCPNQMMQIGEHIITVQGHPEFSIEFAKARLNSRRNLMPAATYETAMSSFSQAEDSKIIGEWIRHFRNWSSSSI